MVIIFSSREFSAISITDTHTHTQTETKKPDKNMSKFMIIVYFF